MPNLTFPNGGIYTGFSTPAGNIPKGIRGNHRQQENDYQNDRTYVSYLWRLMDLAVSVFEWKNLPKGINTRMFERWLLADGMVLFAHDEALAEDPDQRSPEGYAMLRMTFSGGFDVYNQPKKRTAYTVDPAHALMEFDITSSVICYNDSLGVPTFPTLELYATRLWRLERTIDVNIEQQKTPRVVRCSEKQRMSLQNAMAQVDGYMNTIWADKALDLDGVEVLDTTAPLVAQDLQAIKHQIWNEALTYLGIENTNTDKKERLITDEVMSNMGDVEAQRFTRLNARKQFCEEVNDMFGLDIDVDFRSGVYIRTDQAGMVPTEGMEGATPLDEGGYR